ncbi:MAG: MFS transporter [Alphaproteobacteria bacterium]|nr:MAG: MFS transporter [Alphaproteobacteria bacterium]
MPALLAVALILWAVREPPAARKPVRAPLSRAEIGRLGRGYWQVVGVAVAFTLARFSEAFLVLRAEGAGLSFTLLPLVFVALNVAYFLSAYPAGALSDRVDRAVVLIPALVVLAAAQVALAWGSAIGIGAGIILWGLHMGLSEGILSALVADAAPVELRGTAYGVFHLVTGVAMLAASALAGALWQFAGPAFSFAAGAGFALIALAGVLALRRKRRPEA